MSRRRSGISIKASGRAKATGISKANLPTKVCVTCGRPFTWRRKWAACWEQVRYCSDRCRGR